MAPSFELAVISDVHIRDCNDIKIQKIRSLFRWLKDNHCKTLILNGDIFDVFIANNYFKKYYASLFQSLQELSKSTQVIYIQGNHEFFLEKLNLDGIEVISSDIYKHSSQDHGDIYVAHGDHLHPSKSYHMLRSLLRHPITWAATHLLPGALVNKICLAISDLSKNRNKGREKKIPHKKILQTIEDHSRAENCKTAVIGHYHTPWAQTKNSHSIFGLHCWDHPNALVFNHKGAWRLQPENDDNWSICAPKPFIF